jgi:8-oxo-dGTP pyrophosphatase MutT (NUDIX family)
MPREVEKVVCYVVHDNHLLVFTHDNQPMTVTGVQVPAGSIAPWESPVEAAIRELFEETGRHGDGPAERTTRPAAVTRKFGHAGGFPSSMPTFSQQGSEGCSAQCTKLVLSVSRSVTGHLQYGPCECLVRRVRSSLSRLRQSRSFGRRLVRVG